MTFAAIAHSTLNVKELSMRTRRNELVIGLAALAAIAISGGASTASAQQAGGGGPACTRVMPTTNVQFSSSGAANKGPGTAAVACSAVRLATTSPAAVAVNVVDSTTTGLISCSFSVRSFNGASSLFSSVQDTTNSFTGAQQFSATIPTNVVGYVSVNCALPEPSGGNDSRLVGFTIQ
jgi:hypothetical protein